jgi:ribokinase
VTSHAITVDLAVPLIAFVLALVFVSRKEAGMVRALVVGSLVMDLAFRVPKRPEPGEVIVATDHGKYRGGKGYNQAVALARLGADVTFVGAVGADANGDDFLSGLQREGVKAERIVQLRGSPTAVAVPLVTPDGDVGFVQYPGANWQLAPAHVADLPDCDVLLLQGEVTTGASLAAARVIRRRGAIVLLNPAPVHEMTPELLDAATVLCPNEVEARGLFAEAGGGTASGEGEDLARALATDERLAVVTLGAQGAAWATTGESGVVRPPQVEAVDATGAGDSFCAALALALAEGAAPQAAVRFACAAGAHAATQQGAEPGLPTRAQVEALLADAG